MNKLLQINWTDIQYTSEEMDRAIYAFPLHLRVLIAITLFFLATVLILLFIILASRIRKTKRAERKVFLQKKYQDVFSKILYDDHPDFNVIDPKDLKHSFDRDTLTQEIVHLHENFSGEIAARLEELFRASGLYRDSITRLNHRRWDKKAAGMREIALMNLREATDKVAPYITSKNEILRYEARVTIMKLSVSDPLSFLDKETEWLSDWDQANIFTMLRKMPDSAIPDFSRWLTSKNPSVVAFAISMIGTYHQHQAVPQLISMLDHTDERQRLLIIRALRQCEATVAEKKLIERYESETSTVQDEILHSFSTLGATSAIQFLDRLLEQPQEDIAQTILIIRSLLSAGPVGISAVDKRLQHGDDRLQMAIHHAKDQRL